MKTSELFLNTKTQNSNFKFPKSNYQTTSVTTILKNIIVLLNQHQTLVWWKINTLSHT